MGRTMNVAGIDYSTKAVDIVVIPEHGPPAWHRFPLTGNDAFDRTRSVADAMPGRHSVFWDDVLAVGIEHPGGKFGTRELLRVQGAILSCVPARMLVEPWPPAKWRKAVGLAGNASKVDVRDWSLLHGLENHTVGNPTASKGWPQDAHDAHLIALATRQAITTTQAA